jgi:hypothetical protein
LPEKVAIILQKGEMEILEQLLLFMTAAAGELAG